MIYPTRDFPPLPDISGFPARFYEDFLAYIRLVKANIPSPQQDIHQLQLQAAADVVEKTTGRLVVKRQGKLHFSVNAEKAKESAGLFPTPIMEIVSISPEQEYLLSPRLEAVGDNFEGMHKLSPELGKDWETINGEVAVEVIAGYAVMPPEIQRAIYAIAAVMDKNPADASPIRLYNPPFGAKAAMESKRTQDFIHLGG